MKDPNVRCWHFVLGEADAALFKRTLLDYRKKQSTAPQDVTLALAPFINHVLTAFKNTLGVAQTFEFESCTIVVLTGKIFEGQSSFGTGLTFRPEAAAFAKAGNAQLSFLMDNKSRDKWGFFTAVFDLSTPAFTIYGFADAEERRQFWSSYRG